MRVVPLASLEDSDERLVPFRQLKGRGPDDADVFVVEGAFLAEKALADGLEVVSMLLEEKMLERLAPNLPEHVTCLTGTRDEMASWVGFDFHRGVLSCLRRPVAPDELPDAASACVLMLPRIDGAESLGLLLRSAAALGMDEVWVGGGPDPCSRRVSRVSMGGNWMLPVRHAGSEDALYQMVVDWRAQGASLVAAMLSDQAVPLSDWRPQAGAGLLLGPEAYGLSERWQALADIHVCIPMARGMDSLNVAIAGGILMQVMTCA